MNPLLSMRNVSKRYRLGNRLMEAVAGFSLDIYPNEIVGLFGESGSGKSTLARLALGLEQPSEGQIFYEGKNLHEQSPSAQRQLRRELQMIFQDPLSSLNPRMTILDLVAEGIDIHYFVSSSQRLQRVVELLELVGLSSHVLYRYPHEFSGGQRQRICIARALAVQPRLIICDEPLSALDLSVQAQIINLLKDLQKKMSLSYLFIAHDLAMIRYLSNRAAVMEKGRLIELAPTTQLFDSPTHPKTQRLIASSMHRIL